MEGRAERGTTSLRVRVKQDRTMTGYMLRPGSPDGREERLAPAEGKISVLSELAQRRDSRVEM